MNQFDRILSDVFDGDAELMSLFQKWARSLLAKAPPYHSEISVTLTCERENEQFRIARLSEVVQRLAELSELCGIESLHDHKGQLVVQFSMHDDGSFKSKEQLIKKIWEEQNEYECEFLYKSDFPC